MESFILTCDTNNNLWTCAVWDPHTGTNLMTYKGGGAAETNTLTIIGTDYVAAVEKGKPLLHVWPVNSQQTVQGMRFVMPGRPSAFAFTVDGSYCIAGIDEKIYLWQMTSGSLLTIISRHYQKIRHLKFTSDGNYFISAAEDGMLMVWSLRVVAVHSEVEHTSQSTAGQHDPIYIFNDHASSITGVHISKFGMHGRLCTVSSDKTCKIYDLSCGEMLLNLIFNVPLTSVTMDTLELKVFVGTDEGKIHEFCLTVPPRNRDLHINEDKSSFVSHNKAVTSLSVSIGGDILISGSEDETVVLWHILSREPIRTIKHKGPVTNAFFTTDLKAFRKQELSPKIILHNLQRTLDKDIDEIREIEVLTKTKVKFWPEPTENEMKMVNFVSPAESEMANTNIESEYIEDLQRHKVINAQLYNFAVNTLKSNFNNNVQNAGAENGITKKRKRSK